MNVPETRYARSGDVHIAYQVLGDGPVDLVFVPGFVSNVEATWTSPPRADFFRRLASFSRLILFDKRGTGMSDRSSQIFTLEQRMADVLAVMDAAGSKRAALFGLSEGGPMSFLFAASYPQRTSALVVYGSYAKRSWAADYPFGWKPETWDTVLGNIERAWGTPEGINLAMWAPSVAGDEQRAAATAAYFRAAASPGAALAVMKMNREIDVRDILPSVRVPTLILHRTGERVIDVENARATWRAASPARSSSSCRASTTCPGPQTSSRWSRRSRSSSPESAMWPSPSACWRRCSSPTSSSPPSAPQRSATASGATFWRAFSHSCAVSYPSSGGVKSIPRDPRRPAYRRMRDHR